MNLRIYENEHEETIYWQQAEEGSKTFACRIPRGNFGQLIFKRLKGKGFTIYHNDLMPLKNISVINTTSAFLGLAIMYKNQLQLSFNKQNTFHFHANHFAFAYLPACDCQAALKGGTTYSIVSFHFSSAIIKEVEAKYPAIKMLLHSALKNKMNLYYRDQFYVDKPMLAVVEEIIENNYTDEWRDIILDMKVKELLVKTIAHLNQLPKKRNPIPNTNDKEKILLVPAIIIEHIDYPAKRSVIAKKALLNTYKLKEGFRNIFGLTIQEFYSRHRLYEARCLLIYTHTPIYTIAEKTGYTNSSSFSKAFKKAYHTSPNSYRISFGNMCYD